MMKYEAILTADMGRGNEILFGFLADRHKGQIAQDAERPTHMTLAFGSLGESEDMFEARCLDCESDLGVYGFKVESRVIRPRFDPLS